MYRYGHVTKVTPEGDNGVKVEFATRRDAEVAMKRGSSYSGQKISVTWFEEPYKAPSDTQKSQDSDGREY